MRDADAASVLELPVRLREELGSDVQIHCGIGAVAHHAEAAAQDVTSLATLVARMDPQTALAEGQNARVHVETTKLHFFDPETGAAIRD
jgi:multiple sugar transport system ATP-binding protein